MMMCLCTICQEATKEKVQCPAKESYGRFDIGSGYVSATLAKILRASCELGAWGQDCSKKKLPRRKSRGNSIIRRREMAQIVSFRPNMTKGTGYEVMSSRQSWMSWIELAKEYEKISLKMMKQK